MQPVKTNDLDLAKKARDLEHELLETEKALAEETLEHSRSKETLAYTRGLLDRAEKNEAALYKYIDKQEDRHQIVVSNLEEKIIDANRKIATIARELGSKEERISLLAGQAKLPGRTEKVDIVEVRALPLDIVGIWGTLWVAISIGVMFIPSWSLFQRIAVISAFFWVVVYTVLKFWAELVQRQAPPHSLIAKKLRLLGRIADVTFVLFGFAFLALLIFQLN